MNWSTELRIKGKLRYTAPTLTVDNYQTSTRKVTQIQDKSIKNFEVETSLIPDSIGDLFTENGVIANNVFITTYDLFAYKKLIDFIIKRIDRSYGKIFDFIYKIDKISLKRKKPIDFKIIKEALGE